MRNKIFLLCGILAPVVYVLTVFVGGVFTPGYSHVSQYVSELIQTGAPKKIILGPLFALYNVLVILFGIGLFQYVKSVQKHERKLVGILGALTLVIEGLAGLLTLFFPQDPIGSQITTTGTMHIILASVSSLTTMLSMLLLGLWFRTIPALHGVGLYSLVFLAVVFVSGGFAARTIANPSPYNGLIERVTIGGFLLWLFVIGWELSFSKVPKMSASNLEGVNVR
jgi:hypothetical membrane protein